MRWDVFCKVIDNHGDAGVCWRLATQLARRGGAVRLWIDDPSMLAWMAPQGEPGVEVVTWEPAAVARAEPADVVIEAFGCDLDASYVAAMAQRQRSRGRAPAWINLEYLTAEAFAARCHGLPSPVLAGPGAGLVKHFFYPGFTTATGGLLREPDLDVRQSQFDRARWLHGQGIAWSGECLVSLFCYEPESLDRFLAQLAEAERPVRLLVTAGRPTAAVRAALARQPADTTQGSLRIDFLPFLSQQEFDHLLWSCDLNFVRGEDSLVRALWAGKPLVWQAYAQEGGAHLAKLQAFLDWLDAPGAVRAWHASWNAAASAGLPPLAPLLDPATTRLARARLAAQADLVTRLQAFVASGAGGAAAAPPEGLP